MSKRRYIDPSDFIQHLGLDAAQQQDAQEFSKLFLNVLEENLLQSKIPSPRNVIKEQFCGSYAYVTRCSHCRSASERQSEFYELDLNIQGHRTLDDSLKAFLEVEKLEGDNQYMCGTCNRKQNATRAIELKQLPPVLNFQLLRFVFEVKTGSKKKLNSIIQFPDTLDMSGFLPSRESAVYDLTAVLIHRGPSAYSGHFVAHIKGKDSQAWYKFNDEEIEKIKGRNLQLGNEEDLELKQKKSVRTPKGFHSSKNAYMLVYSRQLVSPVCKAQTDSTCVEVSPAKVETTVLSVGETKQGLLLTENGTCVSLVSQLESRTEDKSEVLPLTEDENRQPFPKMVSLSPKMSPKKSEFIPYSKSEVLFHKVAHTSEFKTQSLQDCTISTTNSNFTAETFIDKPAPSKEKVLKKEMEPAANKLLPKYVLDYIEYDNEAFEKWVLEMTEMKNKNIATGREKQETVRMIYQDLVLRDSPDQQAYEWLPGTWLSKWLNDPNIAPPVDVSKFLCSHGKICPHKSAKMKCVSQTGSEQLYNIYGGRMRLLGEESLCIECVKNKCNHIRTKLQIAEDDKVIAREMKAGVFGKKCFWIGKGSFRSWRRLALERLGDAVDEGNEEANSSNLVENCNGNDGENSMLGANTENNDAESSVLEDKTIETAKENDKRDCKAAMEKDEDDETLQFNEDLLCETHRDLDPDISCRKLIPETVWLSLKKYFPGCPEFDDQSVTCKLCQSCREQENELKQRNKQAAIQQKAALMDLFHDRKRPTLLQAGSSVFVVNTPFISQWRQFLRDPIRADPMSTIINTILLCRHGRYLFLTPGDNVLRSDENVTYLHGEEWQRLKEYYAVDCEIEIVCLKEGDKEEIITIPEVCDECIQTRLIIEESEVFNYDNAVLYVRKQLKVEANIVNENSKDDCPKENLEFDNKASSNGRKRTISGGGNSEEPAEKMTKASDNGKIVRKSQRHRRARGEREVTMSSKRTLKDLKVQIMRLFSVPPFDQNLYIKGKKLEADNSSSLGDMRIAPGTVIDLVADEVEGDPVILEELHKESGVPEAGFKGTNLLSS